jgi:hypothetical protein
MGFEGLIPSSDVAPAAWIADGLAPFGQGVGSLIPDGYEAYARVLHPAMAPGFTHRSVRWAEVAAWSGRILHGAAQFGALSRPRAGGGAGPAPWDGNPPHQGGLFEVDAQTLAEVLRAHTSTPDTCWFCLWNGYGFLSPPASATFLGDPRLPLVRLPHRDYHLLAGPVEAAARFQWGLAPPPRLQDGPNLWWPEDRAWFVASEIDLDSTYVGGSAELVARLLADARLEAVPSARDDGIKLQQRHAEPADLSPAQRTTASTTT